MDPIPYVRACFHGVGNWLHHNIVFIKSILFISGLIWSTMMEKTFVKMIITAHGSGGEVYDLRSAVVVVNLHRGISGVLVVAFTYAIDAYRRRLGRFLAVVFSTTACILGLIYIFLAAKGKLHLWSHYLSMAIMVSAQVALIVTLKEFLDDQFRPMYPDYYERQQLTKLFWNPASLLASKIARFVPLTGLHSEELVLVLIIVMVCIIFVFLLTSCFHNNYAAPAIDPHDIEGRIAEVSLLWLWVCLLILSLVSASGSTFFFLEDGIPKGNRNYVNEILSLDYWLRCTEASSYAFRQFGVIQQYNQQTMELLRVGIALMHSVLCCTISMGTSAIIVHWLTPHSILMGLMVGLAKNGFQWLYESQAPSHLKRYGWASGELARGVGSLLSILCIFVFRGGDFSGMYYVIMAGLSVCNIILYLLVVFWYMGGWTLLEDEEIYDYEHFD